MPRTAFALLAVLLAVPRALRAADLTPKEIYQKNGPAVVLIIGADQDGAGELGTGSLIDDQGHILTNAHVVIRDSTKKPFETLRGYYKPKRLTGDPKVDLVDPVELKVLDYDRALDLALLEGPARPKVEPIALGDAEAVEAGEPVVAIGHPEQGGLWTLTTGVVSTVVSDLGGVPGKDAFQTDASINRGNSGGPLINRRGDLIGVNTSMARKAADGLTITSVNFSLKSSVVRDFLARKQDNTGLRTIVTPPPAPGPKEEPAPAPKPAPKVEAAPEPAPKPAIVTPVKPYKIEDVIEREIAEMEDLEKEMMGEVEKRRGPPTR